MTPKCVHCKERDAVRQSENGAPIDKLCRECAAELLRPMTREEAEFAAAGVGNVLPMTDAEIEDVMTYVLTRAKAGDN